MLHMIHPFVYNLHCPRKVTSFVSSFSVLFWPREWMLEEAREFFLRQPLNELVGVAISPILRAVRTRKAPKTKIIGREERERRVRKNEKNRVTKYFLQACNKF